MAGQAAACWGSCLLLLLHLLGSCEAVRPMQVIKSWASIVTEDGLVSINLSLIPTAYFFTVHTLSVGHQCPTGKKGDTSAALIAVGEFFDITCISRP